MKPTKSPSTFRPFKDLGSLLKSKEVVLKAQILNVTDEDSNGNSNPDDEQRLFFEAMSGVTPISKGNYVERTVEDPHSDGPIDQIEFEESEALARLNNLVQSGDGFRVTDTSEYIDGVGYHVNPAVTKYLHRGNFSVQAHIDLHGLTVVGAKEALDGFFRESIETGKRTVLVIHGRGLSSPDKPILKTKVHEWLTTGSWRKWVIAFTSAHRRDGGTGATYVMLRQRPTTRKFRKCR